GTNYGGFLWKTGRVVEGEKAFRAALEEAQRLVDDFPGIPPYRQDLAGAHGNLGSLLWKTGRPAEAREPLEQACTVMEKLAADFPTVPAYQSTLGGMLNN